MERKMMSPGSWFLWILGLGIILAMVGTRCVHATISCSESITTLMPCLPFLMGASEAPTAPCCTAVSKLNDEASTTENRRALCRCFKDAAPRFGVIPDKAKELPQMCAVTVPVPIDPNINCDTIPLLRDMN